MVEIRRERLRQWFTGRSIPPAEKSYISQLMSGKASFGERAARRLEDKYGMGEKYLDRLPEEEKNEVERFLRGPGINYVDANEIAHLILLYKAASTRGRQRILEAAQLAADSAASNSTDSITSD